MELEQFVKNFAIQFEETELSEFNPDTTFKELEEWSSLLALSVIAMVDEEYGVTLKGEDIKNSTTIAELYQIVESRK